MTYYKELEAPSAIKNWLLNKSKEALDFVLEADNRYYYDEIGLVTFTELLGQYVNELDGIKTKNDAISFLKILKSDGLNRERSRVFFGEYNGDKKEIPSFYIEGFHYKKGNDLKKTSKFLKPLIQKWISSNITNKDILLIYEKWLSNPNIDENILTSSKNLANTIFAQNSEIATVLSEDIEYTDFSSGLAAQTYTLKLNLLLEDLINSTNNHPVLDVPSVFGFDDYFESGDGSERFISGSNLEQRGITLVTAKNLEELLKKSPQAFGEIVGAAQGDDYKKPTEEELINLRQCALVTRLLHDTVGKIPFSNYFNNGNFAVSPLNPNNEKIGNGHNRIYPVDPAGDPNEFYNRCFISNEAKNSFVVNEFQDTQSPSDLYKKLYWVFDTDEGLKEIELNLSSNKKAQAESQNYFLLSRALREWEGAGTTQQKQARVRGILGEDNYKDANQIRDALNDINSITPEDRENSAYYFLKDIEIKYEGTNPSTARNDVQVQMSFELSSLKALEKAMATVPAKYTSKREDADIKLYELITLPVTSKISKGPGAYLKNQFNPEYSRVRLKVYTDVNHGCDLIIDLSTIDHSLSRESETGKTTLTINYRGFFEAMMNMPFNDALADRETLLRRESLHAKAMTTIKTNDCKPELINKAMRIEQEIFRREARELSAGSILMRMQRRQLIHGYGLDEAQVLGRAVNGSLDSSRDYVTNVFPGGALSEEQYKKLAEVTKKQEEGDDKDLPFLKNKFFFLGDLLWVVSGCLYEDDSAKMRELTKNLNLRFLLGTINVPNPKTRDGSMITINPACIPVDLSYFVEWFNATIVNKGITTYPVGIFIKDLIERMVNNVIFEVCFSSLLPSEKPPVIRVGFVSNFVNESVGWLKKNENGWFDVNDPYGRGAMIDNILTNNELTSEQRAEAIIEYNRFASSLPNAIFSRDALFNESNSVNPHVNDINPYNYCIIYQQFPTFSHYITKDENNHLKNKPYVPTIFYGAKNTKHNYVSNVSFSKTDSPFLREARYFNSNYGNLSLLSNVYDLSFSFSRRKANTFLYPGIILNFVLLDWTTSGTTSPYVKLSNSNGDYKIFDQSNPHDAKTLAHILGFGGYYIIKSVTYKLSQTSDVWEINVTTKFMGTDAPKEDIRTSSETENLEDKEECVEAYNELVERVNDLKEGDDDRYDPAIVEKQKEEQEKTEDTDNNKKEEVKIEKVQEVPVEPEKGQKEPTQDQADQTSLDKQKFDAAILKVLDLIPVTSQETNNEVGDESSLNTVNLYQEISNLNITSYIGYYQPKNSTEIYYQITWTDAKELYIGTTKVTQ